MEGTEIDFVPSLFNFVLYFRLLYDNSNQLLYMGQIGNGMVIWLTGLSASGKTTIAEALINILKEQERKVEHLDGDLVRKMFPGTGFTREERDRHVKRIGYLAAMLEKHDVLVVASFISPYMEARSFVRAQCKNFVEVYVSTSLEECEKRDPKGLYKKARSGEISNFTGISDPYEPPENPEIIIDTTGITVNEATEQILKHLAKQTL